MLKPAEYFILNDCIRFYDNPMSAKSEFECHIILSAKESIE